MSSIVTHVTISYDENHEITNNINNCILLFIQICILLIFHYYQVKWFVNLFHQLLLN